MKLPRWSFVVFGLLGLLTINLRAAEPKPAPTAEEKPVVNEYHGIKVEDDYQWLENDDDPTVKAWSDAENTHTRAYLDSLPSHAAVEKQLNN